jgi:cytochrome d ubiquinol oxidase subunit II
MFRTLTVRHHDYWPFFFALGLFVLGFSGLGFSMFPYIVPVEITIWEAAAPRNSQIFMLVGASVLVPVILAYTAFSYWVFRGKIIPGEGYH